ncbi:uncharacterized protein LOC123392794 [Mustela putorius furo]|uniref:Uncharacterized protein LOC123392794 n=1 Tax=Mustela putorius furo TaxID=9669 RepID=A0A8U0SAV0_MUSPF|nr:uncharacterized protein LOC123392794 [Mustela putorius furo]
MLPPCLSAAIPHPRLACFWSVLLWDPVTWSLVGTGGRGKLSLALGGERCIGRVWCVFQLSALPWCVRAQEEAAVWCLGSGRGVPAGTGVSAPTLGPYPLKGPPSVCHTCHAGSPPTAPSPALRASPVQRTWTKMWTGQRGRDPSTPGGWGLRGWGHPQLCSREPGGRGHNAFLGTGRSHVAAVGPPGSEREMELPDPSRDGSTSPARHPCGHKAPPSWLLPVWAGSPSREQGGPGRHAISGTVFLGGPPSNCLRGDRAPDLCTIQNWKKENPFFISVVGKGLASSYGYYTLILGNLCRSEVLKMFTSCSLLQSFLNNLLFICKPSGSDFGW